MFLIVDTTQAAHTLYFDGSIFTRNQKNAKVFTSRISAKFALEELVEQDAQLGKYSISVISSKR